MVLDVELGGYASVECGYRYIKLSGILKNHRALSQKAKLSNRMANR
jgi:hypothetical protein